MVCGVLVKDRRLRKERGLIVYLCFYYYLTIKGELVVLQNFISLKNVEVQNSTLAHED